MAWLQWNQHQSKAAIIVTFHALYDGLWPFPGDTMVRNGGRLLSFCLVLFHCQWCGWNRKWHRSGLGSSWLIFSFVTWFSLSFFVSLSSFLSFSIYRLDQNGQSLWSRVLQFYLLKRISPLKFIFGMLTRIETSKLVITYKF